MFDIRMQTNNQGVIGAEGLTRNEAAQYIAKHIDEAPAIAIRQLLTDAKEFGAVNVTTVEGNDIGVEYYTESNAKVHLANLFAGKTRCGRDARTVETVTARFFSSVTCAVCSGRTSH